MRKLAQVAQGQNAARRKFFGRVLRVDEDCSRLPVDQADIDPAMDNVCPDRKQGGYFRDESVTLRVIGLGNLRNAFEFLEGIELVAELRTRGLRFVGEFQNLADRGLKFGKGIEYVTSCLSQFRAMKVVDR